MTIIYLSTCPSFLFCSFGRDRFLCWSLSLLKILLNFARSSLLSHLCTHCSVFPNHFLLCFDGMTLLITTTTTTTTLVILTPFIPPTS
jgi:hypothetical protein